VSISEAKQVIKSKQDDIFLINEKLQKSDSLFVALKV
jgi:hypothetical protein